MIERMTGKTSKDLKTSCEVPPEPRHARTVAIANEFLLNENIESFPVRPLDIILHHGWAVKTFEWLLACEGLTSDVTDITQAIRHLMGSKDSVVYRLKDGTYFIAFSGKARPRTRINFSLAHEIGHIVLGHLEGFDTEGISDSAYRVLESEADCFARNILAPAAVAASLLKAEAEKCQKVFGISAAAWTVRQKLITFDWNTSPIEHKHAQQERFRGFLAGV